MTRSSPFSVRGRHALLIIKDERDLAIVRRQLGRLGMSVSETDPERLAAPATPIDVIVLDADSIPIKSDPGSALTCDAPVIALIGTETPSRLKWLLDLQPASFLVKPLRSWLPLIVRSGAARKPRTSSGWRCAFAPAASCSPPCCS